MRGRHLLPNIRVIAVLYLAEMNTRADGVLATGVRMWSCAGPTGSSKSLVEPIIFPQLLRTRPTCAHTLTHPSPSANPEPNSAKRKRAREKENTGIGMSLADMRMHTRRDQKGQVVRRGSSSLPRRSTTDFMRWSPRSDGSGAPALLCRVLIWAIFSLWTRRIRPGASAKSQPAASLDRPTPPFAWLAWLATACSCPRAWQHIALAG